MNLLLAYYLIYCTVILLLIAFKELILRLTRIKVFLK